MNVGTKSVLFGAHQFLIHPWFVAYAWWKLYGFPFDPRLWIAFFLHDLGYWGKPNMDGPEGERHPEFAANFMGFFFGGEWSNFCLYHSRFYSKKHGADYSRLCPADKLAVSFEPWWLYLPRVIMSGEIKEYMYIVKTRHWSEPLTNESKRKWFDSICKYLEFWAYEHRNIKYDKWTKLQDEK